MFRAFDGTGVYRGNLGDLRQGTEYSINVRQDWRGRIYVTVCHGFEWKPYTHLPVIRFNSLKEFLAHWENPKPHRRYLFGG